MKTMTCRDLGGKCDQKLSANSWDEMVKAITTHVMEKHPDVAKQMEKMHKEDPKKWGKEMRPKRGCDSKNPMMSSLKRDSVPRTARLNSRMTHDRECCV